MKEVTKKIIENPYLIFMVLISDLFNLLKPIWQSEEHKDIYYANYDWAGFLLQLLTVIFLYVILKEYISLKKVIDEKTEQLINLKKIIDDKSKELTENIELSHFISLYRHKQTHIKKHASFEQYSNLPNNSELAFAREWFEEFKGVKEMLLKHDKSRTPKEIEEFVAKYYPPDFKEIK